MGRLTDSFWMHPGADQYPLREIPEPLLDRTFHDNPAGKIHTRCLLRGCCLPIQEGFWYFPEWVLISAGVHPKAISEPPHWAAEIATEMGPLFTKAQTRSVTC